MADPATTAATRAAGQLAGKAVSATIDPLVTLRAGGREDVHARCDALEDAILDYFYHPTPEHEMALRQAHLKLTRRCKDERTRTAAWTLTFRVINFRDSAISPADRDEWNSIQPSPDDFDAMEEEEYNTPRRKNGTTANTEALLYLWIDEFHKVVRRGHLVRARESAGRWTRTSARWLRAANPARLFRRRRTAPALPAPR